MGGLDNPNCPKCLSRAEAVEVQEDVQWACLECLVEGKPPIVRVTRNVFLNRTEGERRSCIHMKDVSIQAGGITLERVAWRGRLSDVSGWTFGG